MDEIIRALAERLGRMPTEDEVITFIRGTDEERMIIWNS
jgi:hypothetical protein